MLNFINGAIVMYLLGVVFIDTVTEVEENDDGVTKNHISLLWPWLAIQIMYARLTGKMGEDE